MWRSVGAGLILFGAMVGLVPTAEAAKPADPPAARADVGRATLSAEQRARKGPVAKGLNTLVFDTADSPFDPSSANQGWWSDTVDNGSFANPNYIAGVCCGGDHRNFFTFDLRSLNNRVVFATLRVNTGVVEGDETETLRLSDVSTDAGTLNFNTGRNPAIFRDLGTGAVYGEYVISREQDNVTLDLKLNQRAIRDLNRARGGFFSIGGRVISLSGAGSDEFIFGFSGNTSDDTVQLIARTAPGGPPR
jgi:hypothetical protein